MNTDQATLILGSLLRSQRAFQSYDLAGAARQRIIAIQHLLEEYEEKTASPSSEAQDKLKQAYRLLNAEPPSPDPSLCEHAVLAAANMADAAAESKAWQVFLVEALK